MSQSPPTATWVTIGTFNRLADARELESLLKAYGMSARVYDERQLQRFWFWVHPKAGIHVQVDQPHLESAETFFRQINKLWKRAVRCPECGSSRVQYPAVTRKNMLPAVLDHFFTLLGLTPATYYCESCQYTWSRKTVDTSNAPDSSPSSLV